MVVLFTLLVIVSICGFWFWRKSRLANASKGETPESSAEGPPVPEMDGVKDTGIPQDLSTKSQRHEVNGYQSVISLLCKFSTCFGRLKSVRLNNSKSTPYPRLCY